MCMAAMRLVGVSTVAYAYSNEDGAPFNLPRQTSTQICGVRLPQSMAISHVPLQNKAHGHRYEQWAARAPKGRQ